MTQKPSISYKLQRISKYPGDLMLPPQETIHSIDNVGSGIFISEREGGLRPLVEHLRSQKVTIINLPNLKTEELQCEKIAVACDHPSETDKEIIDEIMSLLETSDKIFYILTNNVTHLMGTLDFSILYNRLNTYHTIANTDLLSRPWPNNYKKLLETHLGTQYILTKRFVMEMDIPDSLDALISNLDDYIDRLIQNPPNYISHWIKQLHEFLGDPDLKSIFGDYMEDEVKAVGQHISQAEIKLYLAGWLRLDDKGNLRIRSIAHQRIAQSLLGGDR